MSVIDQKAAKPSKPSRFALPSTKSGPATTEQTSDPAVGELHRLFNQGMSQLQARNH